MRAKLAESAGDFVEDASGRRTPGTSCSSRAMRTPGAAPDRAAVGRDFAGDDFQQAGFAGAVPADERNALARLDAQIGGFEERQVTERERDRIKGNDRHWSFDLTASWAPLRCR